MVNPHTAVSTRSIQESIHDGGVSMTNDSIHLHSINPKHGSRDRFEPVPFEAINHVVAKPDGQHLTVTNEQLLDHSRPKGVRFALLFGSILLANFAIGYDTSCIATLTPVITDQFRALQDLGWYTIAYLLTQSATMLVYGQLYSFFSMKILFESSMIVFLAGSILTAAAPTSAAFIIGRALTGLGSAGAFAGTTIILAETTSLKRRPVFLAVTGAVETTALAFGPLISGVLAHAVNWRLAFWITVPVCVIIAAVVLFSVNDLRRSENAHLNIMDGLMRIDWTGFSINIPMTLCLVLGLQWAGTMYAWKSWRILLLLVLAGVLLLAFLIVEHRKGDASMVPLKMLRQRSVALASLVTFCNFSHLAIEAYYLPFYFQAVRGAGTLASGIMYLPTAVALAIAALAGGPLTSAIGYYNPTLILGSVLMTSGAGLITTFDVDTGVAKWIAYQVIYGLGIGLAFQPPYIAVQTVLEEKLVPMALVMLSFTQQFGGIVMLSIAQNVLLARLRENLAAELPDLDPRTLLSSGALGLVDDVPTTYRAGVLTAYRDALVQVFYIALGLTCVATISAMGIQWRSVKKEERSG